MPTHKRMTYVPESNKDRINYFITFRDQLSHFGEKGKIILCGDFNARTGNLDDFAEDFSWVSNCRLGVSEREHVRRSNRDHTVNKFGLELIELCHGFKLRILNGGTKGDRLGDFTCFTPNGLSSIDYVVVSEELLTEIMGFVVSNGLVMPMSNIFCIEIGGTCETKKVSSSVTPSTCVFQMEQYIQNKSLG